MDETPTPTHHFTWMVSAKALLPHEEAASADARDSILGVGDTVHITHLCFNFLFLALTFFCGRQSHLAAKPHTWGSAEARVFTLRDKLS